MARSYYSTVFEQDAATVWAVVRDFNGLATWWSAAVSESRIEDGKAADQVGAVRAFKLGESTIRERLLALSDLDRSYSYEFVDPAPFPVVDYVATLRVTPVSDGRSFLEYSVVFDCNEAERGHWTSFFATQVFDPAMKALSEYLSQ
ncbi:SRPBCC family protein [Cryptosporangium aurantiacum]|uniref:Polyketide cyclase / dehydrase and lipid transport n=1 Tax=Cryptosporangium aurantiacum TaxID=134849 RepID=A0A1M7RCY1_9ACTN|nr:SRPBCC family protein [Cryptosporangium aurantiacum]SHN44050.1 Polyketide cyclase / dehydrase and lipid transport [Cryptosporangium aurantiacum]